MKKIFTFGNRLFTNIILRGSVPLLWMQDHKKTSPPIVLTGYEGKSRACALLHFEKLKKFYCGHIQIVNLIDSTGSQGNLQDAFKTIIKTLNKHQPEISLGYTHFDYHKEV